jgi:hypothetical protein
MEALQRNLGLSSDIIHEVLSFGCPQGTDSSDLLYLVHGTVNTDRTLLRDFDILDIFMSAELDCPLAVMVSERSESVNKMKCSFRESVILSINRRN